MTSVAQHEWSNAKGAWCCATKDSHDLFPKARDRLGWCTPYCLAGSEPRCHGWSRAKAKVFGCASPDASTATEASIGFALIASKSSAQAAEFVEG